MTKSVFREYFFVNMISTSDFFRQQSLMLGAPIKYLKHGRNTSRKNSTRVWKKKFFVKNWLFEIFLPYFLVCFSKKIEIFYFSVCISG